MPMRTRLSNSLKALKSLTSRFLSTEKTWIRIVRRQVEQTLHCIITETIFSFEFSKFLHKKISFTYAGSGEWPRLIVALKIIAKTTIKHLVSSIINKVVKVYQFTKDYQLTIFIFWPQPFIQNFPHFLLAAVFYLCFINFPIEYLWFNRFMNI